MLSTLLMALAIALIIEGVIPALFPNKWRAYVLKLANEPVNTIRQIGLFLLLIGIMLFWTVN
ncbi:DUF2065 domain-containing protein [Colwellia sp. MB02u-18]|jgi:uncharacterized protein YjeT (DUF2065 family)|uniref:DUF2065 domain-containing protein n=1 Tax=unclassified Colwellia TaxID=196834 RepID=UPI0015F6A858|nr:MULTISPECIES: DUF2065 domain-containing protein [unclassified Colwellia]MBA6225878.1 DUF2065 domain-containing protein [Colwellia sp. MB3u-45]MBA6267114.1 DUF2065 domain-containing protein [Colwellia sp. MB3u-43]MBA6295201.1 DUF2065 domain-containing protein [Colwellia sp. MB02u-9]MBA6322038.1 DUF2065 domain-containing protein [Colwellia sp. MB02u-19]MBA6325268.1 DUF2065 domain-containing protein [Colwellia sp. MB02u-18]